MVNNCSVDRQARIMAAQEASVPILADLAQLGIRIESLSVLVNKTIDYRIAVPLLLRWLPQVSNMDVKETIVRALTVKWAKGVAAQPLVEEFRKAPEAEALGLKWAIANALSVVADDSVFGDLTELVRDKRHGRAREMLVVAFGNMKDPGAVDILIGLLNDEQVAGHALIALRKLAPLQAQSAVERFLDHPKDWIRNEARRALNEIHKRAA
jgi:hypothetical protein